MKTLKTGMIVKTNDYFANSDIPVGIAGIVLSYVEQAGFKDYKVLTLKGWAQGEAHEFDTVCTVKSKPWA